MKRSRAIIRLTRFPALGLWVANALFFLGHSPAFAQAPQPAVEQLQIEIRKRDALIEDLLRRVGNLEREVGKPTAAVGPGSAGARKPILATRGPSRSWVRTDHGRPALWRRAFRPCRTASAGFPAGSRGVQGR